MKPYIQNQIDELRNEMISEGLDNDPDYMDMIEKLEAKNTDFEIIEIDNEITIATLRKIIKNMPWDFNDYCATLQPLEDLDNGFITKDLLDKIIKAVFNEKSDGSFPKSTSQMFQSRNQIRFIKTKLEELLCK
jgi:hypothetical protein